MDDQPNQSVVATPRRDWVKITLALALGVVTVLLLAVYVSGSSCRRVAGEPLITMPTESGEVVIPGRPMTDEERARAMAEWQAQQAASK